MRYTDLRVGAAHWPEAMRRKRKKEVDSTVYFITTGEDVIKDRKYILMSHSQATGNRTQNQDWIYEMHTEEKLYIAKVLEAVTANTITNKLHKRPSYITCVECTHCPKGRMLPSFPTVSHHYRSHASSMHSCICVPTRPGIRWTSLLWTHSCGGLLPHWKDRRWAWRHTKTTQIFWHLIP